MSPALSLKYIYDLQNQELFFALKAGTEAYFCTGSAFAATDNDFLGAGGALTILKYPLANFKERGREEEKVAEVEFNRIRFAHRLASTNLADATAELVVAKTEEPLLSPVSFGFLLRWRHLSVFQISRHRRNHSQHNLTLPEYISPLEQTVIKEGYLLKARIADGGKKLRKNWTSSWLVLTGRKIEFYKESKQPAVANLSYTQIPKPGYKPEWVDLCGAQIEWTTEKSSKKNVFQVGNDLLLSHQSLAGRLLLCFKNT
ncbi:Rho GTPase-activating protein 15 [Varanus komodoensis]|nr:Rho GTPase-activating protein 15 [Varanus komodoensis]